MSDPAGVIPADLEPAPDPPPPDFVLNIRLGPVALRTAVENPAAAEEGLYKTTDFVAFASVLLLAERLGLPQAAQGQLLRISTKTLRDTRDRLGLAGLSGDELVRRIQERGVQILDPQEAQQATAWIAPGYDPMRLHDELIAVIRSGKGYVDQRLMYLDLDSAARWLDFARSPAYVQMYSTMPLDRAAAATVGCTSGAGLDIIALGPGGGEREVQYVQHLVERLDVLGDTPVHRLSLIDISHPLLTAAYQHAGQVLLGCNVATAAVQGDFAQISHYHQLMYRPVGAHRQRVITMFGGTFGNLLSEPHFVRESLGGMTAGDLFLIDVAVAPEDQAQDARIRGLPPELRKAFQEWLVVPLRRYGALREEETFTITAERVHAVIPGSYSLDQVVRTQGGKVYSMTTVRRYNVTSLAQSLSDLGWRHVETFEFGQQGQMAHPRALLLFQKQEDAP